MPRDLFRRIGTPTSIVYDAMTALLGVYYVTVGIVGHFRRDMGPVLRVVMVLAGAAAFLPDSAIGLPVPGLVSAAGVLIGGLVLGVEYFNHRSSPVLRTAAE